MQDYASTIAINKTEQEIKELLRSTNGMTIQNKQAGYSFQYMAELKRALEYQRADKKLIAECLRARNKSKVAGLFTKQHLIETVARSSPQVSFIEDVHSAVTNTLQFLVWMSAGDLEQADRLFHLTELYQQTLAVFDVEDLPALVLKTSYNNDTWKISKYRWDEITPYGCTAGEFRLFEVAKTMKKFRLPR